MVSRTNARIQIVSYQLPVVDIALAGARMLSGVISAVDRQLSALARFSNGYHINLGTTTSCQASPRQKMS